MLTVLRAQWAVFWSQRQARERQMLLLGAVCVLAALVYLLGIEPALKKKNSLEKEIPVLRQQAAAMQGLVAQFAQMNAVNAAPAPALSRETIDTSLARRGIKAQSLSVSDELVRLQVDAVAYDNLLEWCLEMQKVLRLTVEDVKVTAGQAPGQVGAVLTLRQQRADR